MSAHSDITDQTLRQLADLGTDGARVLSVYVDLDPQRFATPPARASQIRSLLDHARRQIDSGQRSHDARKQLRSDLERVAIHLRERTFARGARGYAVFCSSTLDLFETLSLPEPVERSVTIDDAPFIVPLFETRSSGRWCVALVNSRLTRLLRGSASELTEMLSFGDRVHGRHSQGGWSQARYSRSVEHDVEEHFRRTARTLLILYRRRPFSSLLLAAPEELRHQLEDALHSYVRRALVGYIDIDIEDATLDEVRAKAGAAIKKHDVQRLDERLEQLRAALGADGRAAAGAQQVFGSLQERRVGTLLYAAGQPLPGAVCPECGLMQAGGQACPIDGAELEQRKDLLELATRAAVAQDAEVLPVESGDLAPLGGIAALLRF